MTTPAFGEVKEHVRAALLASALSRRLGHPVTLEPAQSYQQLLTALENGEVDAVWGTAELCDRFGPQARAVLRAVRSGSCAYHAAFVCRSDDTLRLDALEGVQAAWVTTWSSAGYLLPRAHLARHGIDPDATLGEQRSWGTYRLALKAVLDGEADFATIYCTHPDERAVRAALTAHVGPRAEELIAFAFTAPTASDGVLVTHRMPEGLSDRFVEAMVELGSGGSGLLPHLGLFDTEGFALDGQVPAPSERRHEGWEPLVLLEVSADSICRRVWTTSGRLHGRDSAAFEGRKVAEVLGAQAAVPVMAVLGDAFRTGQGGRLELMLTDGDAQRWYLAEVTLAVGRAEACLMLRDVTESCALGEELVQLASWPLLSPFPVLEIDRNGRLRYANRAAHARFPGLLAQGADHPIVGALLAAGRTRGGAHEVEVDGRQWKLIAVDGQAEYLRGSAVDVTDAMQKRPNLRRMGGL